MASADQADAALAQALAALESLTDAGSGRSLLELQWIQQLRLQNNRAVFRLALPGYANAQRERIASEARGALLQLSGIDDVQIELAPPPAPSAAPNQGAPIGAAGHVADITGPGAIEQALAGLGIEHMQMFAARCDFQHGG